MWIFTSLWSLLWLILDPGCVKVAACAKIVLIFFYLLTFGTWILRIYAWIAMIQALIVKIQALIVKIHAWIVRIHAWMAAIRSFVETSTTIRAVIYFFLGSLFKTIWIDILWRRYFTIRTKRNWIIYQSVRFIVFFVLIWLFCLINWLYVDIYFLLC